MTSLQWGSCSNVQVGDPLFTKVTSATGFMNARISQTKTTAKMVFCCNHDNLQGMPKSVHFYLPYYLFVCFFLGIRRRFFTNLFSYFNRLLQLPLSDCCIFSPEGRVKALILKAILITFLMFFFQYFTIEITIRSQQ